MELKYLNILDKERYYQFNKLVFGEEGLKEELDKLVYENPFCRIEEECFYLEESGEMLSSILLTKRFQRIGKEIVRVGEFDLVGTHPKHRKIGLCNRLMEHAFKRMKDDGIYLCRLIGIPHFYERFEFEYAVPAYFYSYVNIGMESIKESKGVYSVECIEEFTDDILQQMINLYHEETEENFGSDYRSVKYMRYMIEVKGSSTDSIWYGIFEDKKLVGYAWIKEEKKQLTVKEVMVKNEEAAGSLCRKIYKDYNKTSIDNIGVRSPLNNRFAEYLYKRGASFKCTNQVFSGTWGEKFKILDLKKALNGIKDILQERLKNSKLEGVDGRYSIITQNDRATINIEGATLSICDEMGEKIEISIRNFTAAYTGYRGIDYYKDKTRYESKEAEELFNVLFPQGHPYIWTLDINDSLNE